MVLDYARTIVTIMKLSKRQLAVLSLIGANIIWGASFPIYKLALKDIPPFTFVFLRFFLGSVLILPFTVHNLRIAKEDIGKLVLYATCGISLAISLLFFGLRLAPSINAPIIYSAGPIILTLFAIFYLREKPNKKILIGTVISLLGVLIIVIRPIFESGFSLIIIGNFFLILACIADVTSTITLEKIMKRYSPLTIVFWSFLIGSISILPLAILEQISNPVRTVSMGGVMGIAYGVVLAAVVAHLFFAYGAKYIKTSEIGIFAYVDPIATALVAVPLLGEKITAFYLLGALFVFGGIFIAEGRLHYHPLHLLSKKE